MTLRGGGNGVLTTNSISGDGTFTLLSGTITGTTTANSLLNVNNTNLMGGRLENIVSSRWPVSVIGGTLNIGGTEVSECLSTGDTAYSIFHASNSTVTISGGSVIAPSNFDGTTLLYLLNCSLEMSGGNIQASGQNSAILIYTTSGSSNIKINGGTIENTDGKALDLRQTGTGTVDSSIKNASLGGQTSVSTSGDVSILLDNGADLSGKIDITDKDQPAAKVTASSSFVAESPVNIHLNAPPDEKDLPLTFQSDNIDESDLDMFRVTGDNDYGEIVYILSLDDGVLIFTPMAEVSFVSEDSTIFEVNIEIGSTFQVDSYAEKLSVAEKPGFTLTWMNGSDMWDFEDAVQCNTVLTASYEMIVPEVVISADRTEADIGENITLTAMVYPESEELSYIYVWYLGDVEIERTDNEEYVVHTAGTYTARVVASDGDSNVESSISEPITISFVENPEETDPEKPDVPDIPIISDDDYVPLPPQIVYEGSSNNDAVKVVACAAAAVVAAMVAVLLILVYKKE